MLNKKNHVILSYKLMLIKLYRNLILFVYLFLKKV